MKKLLCIWMLLPLFAQSQDSTLHKVFIGVSFSNDLCYRLAKADNDVLELKSEFDSLESSRYGMTTGIFGGYFIRPNFSIQTGLLFTRRGYAIDTLMAAGLANMKFNYSYLELPIRATHVFRMQSKVQPIVSLGLFAGYMLKHRTTLYEIGAPLRLTYQDGQATSRFNLGVAASCGFQKNIWPNYLFQLDGVFRQSITPLSDTPLKRYLFSAGVNLSLTRLL